MDIGLADRHKVAAALRIELRLHLLKYHSSQPARLMGELLRHQPVEDRDALVHRVLFLPSRCLHLLEAAADDDCHLLATEPARRSTAIHRRVAAAEHDDTAPDLVDMAEGDAGQPVDADMDMAGRFASTRNVEIAAARRAAPDKDRIPFVTQQRLQATDKFA